MIQQALGNELRRRGIHKNVVTIITRVLVDGKDPAFKNPTKSVGPFYTREEAEKIKQEHTEYVFKEDKARSGWRRVVPSPNPIKILEADAIKTLVSNGFIVVASGGGGIPVIDTDEGVRGVDAVIDKDLAGERLASLVRADRFVILTDIDAAYINFRRQDQKKIEKIHAEELKRYVEEGHFA